MKVPNWSRAQIAEAKIVQYLLNDSHPHGKDKAAFFGRFGFTVSAWQILEQALLHHVADNEIFSSLRTDEGVHYVVEGLLVTPDGRNPLLRTVWAIDTGNETPRFITAYPLKMRKGDSDDT